MKIIQFLKRVFSSRIGLVLVCLNIILILYAWYTRDTNMPFDLRYESWLTIVLTVLNIPFYMLAVVIGFTVGFILVNLLGFPTPLDFGSFDWLVALLFCMVVFTLFALQWSLIGYIIEKIIKKLKTPKEQ